MAILRCLEEQLGKMLPEHQNFAIQFLPNFWAFFGPFFGQNVVFLEDFAQSGSVFDDFAQSGSKMLTIRRAPAAFFTHSFF